MSSFKEAFAKTVAADRRLAILRILVEAEGELGESSIEKGLQMWGFRAKLTREVVQADLIALAKVHCVENDMQAGGYLIAKITRIGVQAAQGAIDIEGVSKPQLGC